MLFLAAPEGAVYHSFFGKAWLGCQEISALQVQSQSWNSLNQRVSYSSCYGLRNSLGFSRFGLRLWGLWCLRLPQPVCCRVQELMSDDQREAGRIPRTIECELVQDLVDSCVPGDMVTITGVVKVASTEEGEVQQLRLLFPRMGFFGGAYTRTTAVTPLNWSSQCSLEVTKLLQWRVLLWHYLLEVFPLISPSDIRRTVTRLWRRVSLASLEIFFNPFFSPKWRNMLCIALKGYIADNCKTVLLWDFILCSVINLFRKLLIINW